MNVLGTGGGGSGADRRRPKNERAAQHENGDEAQPDRQELGSDGREREDIGTSANDAPRDGDARKARGGEFGKEALERFAGRGGVEYETGREHEVQNQSDRIADDAGERRPHARGPRETEKDAHVGAERHRADDAVAHELNEGRRRR